MIKRFSDVTVSLLLLIVFGPLMLALALMVGVTNGRPVLFWQTRAGLNGELFSLVKFRTMKNALDSQGHSLPDKDRLTRFGQFMRRSSLDELPEFWNVLKGDMSIVGPRPLLPEYLPRYTADQIRRHEVRPGITGWAQVNGRNSISWEDKFVYDIWYVDHRGAWLDCRILLMTLIQIFRTEEVSPPGQSTMEEFKGSLK